ncbi:MAG: prolipoprotein diacylglyceryl transferase [Hyphomicrobiaceae bacterium]|nr:prolipoprotein diacylglyceryl transferase [Hyphomicrobiaceae bacterium]
MLLVLPFPDIDPIAVALGPIAIRWYSLAYIVGLVAGWRYCRRLAARPPKAIDPDAFDDFLLWATLGVVLGGRLGYVLFYKPAFFIDNPLEVFVLWRGGMSFHGGAAGVILAIILFARKRGVSWLSLGDLVGCAAPIGLFLGRLANFVNGELYGRAADVPWAMVFPFDPEQVPRHPSQLYEAALEGLALFLVIRYFTHVKKVLPLPGYASGIFFAGYALARITAENFRMYDPEHAFSTGILTPGIVYSIPMIAIGAYVIWRARKNASAA